MALVHQTGWNFYLANKNQRELKISITDDLED